MVPQRKVKTPQTWTDIAQLSTAVLATTDPNRSTAVARTTSYYWRPVAEEVGACGGEYSSGRLVRYRSSLRSRDTAAAALHNSAPARDLNMRTSLTSHLRCPLPISMSRMGLLTRYASFVFSDLMYILHLGSRLELFVTQACILLALKPTHKT